MRWCRIDNIYCDTRPEIIRSLRHLVSLQKGVRHFVLLYKTECRSPSFIDKISRRNLFFINPLEDNSNGTFLITIKCSMRLFRSLVILAVEQSVRTLTTLYRGRFNRGSSYFLDWLQPTMYIAYCVTICNIRETVYVSSYIRSHDRASRD